MIRRARGLTKGANVSSLTVTVSDLRPGDVLIGQFKDGVIEPFLDRSIELHAIRCDRANGIACWIVDAALRYADGRTHVLRENPFWDHYVFAVAAPRPSVAVIAPIQPAAATTTPTGDRFPHACPRCGARAYIGAGPVEHEVERGCPP
jgi:hypothetical protein